MEACRALRDLLRGEAAEPLWQPLLHGLRRLLDRGRSWPKHFWASMPRCELGLRLPPKTFAVDIALQGPYGRANRAPQPSFTTLHHLSKPPLGHPSALDTASRDAPVGNASNDAALSDR